MSDLKQFLEKSNVVNNTNDVKQDDTNKNATATNLNDFVTKSKQRFTELENQDDKTKLDSIVNSIKEGASNFISGAEVNFNRLNALGADTLATSFDILTPLGENKVFSPALREYAQNQRDRMNYNLDKSGDSIAGLAGQIIGDPLILTPAGYINKGAKLERIGKSALAGAGIGATTEMVRNQAEGEPILDNVFLSGGVSGGINALIAAVTKGKVDDATKIKNEIANYFNRQAKQEATDVASDDVMKLADEIYKEDTSKLANIANNNYVSEEELQGLLSKEAERQAKRDDKLLKELQKFNKSDNPTPEKFNEILNKYGNKRMEDDYIGLYEDLKAYEKTGRNDPMELRAIYDKHITNTQGTKEYDLMQNLKQYNESGEYNPLQLQKIFADYRNNNTVKQSINMTDEEIRLNELLKKANNDPVKIRKILDDYNNVTPESRANFSRYTTKADEVKLPTKIASKTADDTVIKTQLNNDAKVIANDLISNNADILNKSDKEVLDAIDEEIKKYSSKFNTGEMANTPFDEYVINASDDEIKSLYGTTKDDLINIRNRLNSGEEITQSERNTLNKVFDNAMNNEQVNSTALKTSIDIAEEMPDIQAINKTVQDVVDFESSNKFMKAVEGYNPKQNLLLNLNKSALMSGTGGLIGGGSEFVNASLEDREVDYNNVFKNALIGGLIGFGASKGRAGLSIQNINKPVQTELVNKSSLKNAINAVKENGIVDWFFNTRLNKHTDYMKNRTDMYIALDKGNQAVADIFRGLSKLSTEAKTQLHEYLVGDIKTADASIVRIADTIRKTAQEQGQKAVDLGFLSQEAFDEWKEIYLYRVYDKSYIKDLKSRLSKAITTSPIEPRGKIWRGTQEELAEYEAQGKIGRLAEGNISYKVEKDGSVTFRRDWTKEERTKMGEITDGAFTVANTFQRLNNLITVGKFLEDTDGLYGIISKEKIPGYQQLNGVKWGALNGKYVPNEIANDLKGVSNALLGRDNPAQEMYQDYLRLWKRSKTVYNPTSHINNVIGNATLLMMEGYPVGKSLSYIMRDSMTLNGLDKLKDLQASKMVGQLDELGEQELQKLLSNKNIRVALEAEQYGLFEGNRIDEMLMTYADMGSSAKHNVFSKIADKTKIAPLLEKMQKAYRVEDNAARLSMYSHLRNTRGMTPEEAIKEIRRLVPDYRQPMARGFQLARDTGALPFISWTYYTFPAIVKQMNIFGKTNAGTGLNKYRAFNIAKILGTVALLDMALTPDVNMWTEQPKGFLGKRLPLSVDSQGNVTGLKVDRWVQQTQFLEPWEFIRSNLASGVPQRVAYNLISGQDPYFTNKITYNEGLRGAVDTAEYLTESYVPLPQFMYNVYDFGKALAFDEETRRTQRTTNPRTIPQQLAMFFGLNLYSYNMPRFQEQLRREALNELKKERKKLIEQNRGR